MRRVLIALALLSLPLAPAGAGDHTYCHRAISAQNADKHDLAIDYYTRCLKRDDLSIRNQANFYNNRGLAYSDKGENDRAIADYNQALRLNPDFVGIYNNRGLAYWRKGENDRAIADYDQALRLDPEMAFAYNGRGNAYYEKGEYDRAIADYDQALRLGPDYALAYNGRGNAYYEKGEYDRAIADYDQALRLDPEMAFAYNGRGNAYYNKDEYDRAIADFDQALRLDPDYTFAYNNRGLAYSHKAEYDRAISDYDQALRLDPDYAPAYSNRGKARFYLGRFAQALPDLRRSVAAAPENAFRVLWLYLAQMRAGQGGRAELGDNARRLDLSDWPGPVVRMFLGELGGRAVVDMGKANATRKDKGRRAEAYFYVGQQQLMAGYTDEAAAFFRAVVKTGITNFNEYTGAKAELRRLGG